MINTTMLNMSLGDWIPSHKLQFCNVAKDQSYELTKYF